jgi:hypothetical protein
VPWSAFEGVTHLAVFAIKLSDAGVG